jgi:putative intracellular protease/amidase
MLGRTQKLDKIMKLENINLSNYKGVILACMSAGTFPGVPVSQAEVTVVKKALSEGKPVAANANAANILAEAGVLKGKKFSYWIDPLKTGQYNEKTDPRFAGAIYSGNGVVQDGKIITSGICASMERLSNKEWKDGTAQLTRKFIGELGSK